MFKKICGCINGVSTSTSNNNNNEDRQKNWNRHRTEPEEQQRILKANDREFNAQFQYANNYIKTSKYNLVTFLPVNILEQFNRLANVYFLGLMILQFIPQISSVPWYSTAIPLALVLMVSAIKDGYDDIQRHRSDNQVNRRISYLVQNGRLEEEIWSKVMVGDVIRMENEHFIAGDLLLLSSSEPHGLCYIETAELDGETNLKTRSALPETASLGDIVRDISNFDGEIICEAPNNRLDRFEGRLVYKGVHLPLNNNNMLLRGCRLKNTRWCYGIVVFAGKDTKLMMNSGRSSQKLTSLERFLNVLIIGIVFFLLSMCLICTILYGIWEGVTGRYFVIYLPWDDPFDSENSQAEDIQIAIIAILQFFSYIILLNTVVPISLYISVEMIRFLHSQWINFDRMMYDEKTNTPARARTTTLNEELGQVRYVFSDKTGTLTQNIMIFRKCSINGRCYGDVMNNLGEPIEIDENSPPIDLSKIRNRWLEPTFRFYDHTLLEDTKKSIPEVCEFWKLLSICHTVMPERRPGNILEYQAQSPDESALVSAARNFGFVFKSRSPQSVTIEINGKEETYEVLHILDFDNVRKRMSVIIRGRNGKIKLYCKGADTMILDRIDDKETSELMISATTQHLNKFATEGLRTLCLAYKPVQPDFCEQWMARLKDAMLDLKNKDNRMNELYEEIESELLLLGATAIEDKLQQDVPKTIANLIAANIKETAINIGYSCKLLTEEMKEVFVIEGTNEYEVEVQLKDIKRRIGRSKPKQDSGQMCFSLVQNKFPKSIATLVSNIQSKTCTNPYETVSTYLPSLEGEQDSQDPVAAYIAEQIEKLREFEEGKTETIVTVEAESNAKKGKRRKSLFDNDPYLKSYNQLVSDSLEKLQGSGTGTDQPPINGSIIDQEYPNSPEIVVVGTDGKTMSNGLQTNMKNGHIISNRNNEFGQNRASIVSESEENQQENQFALVINGEALSHALHVKFERIFLEIATQCQSVICCRVTPLQKAQVVNLVKHNIKVVTLAIGDGANDVSMIRMAHIGVGISGKEGMQAVLSVHGRWSYFRMCKFLRYFFYKNFSFTLTNFWFSFFCGYSAQTVFDPMMIACYNSFFTALPVLCMGALDQDVNDEFSVLYPTLYIPGQYNLFFNMRIFIYSIIHGILCSLVIFFVPYGTFINGTDSSGKDMNDYSILALTVFSSLIVAVTGQICFDTSYWTVMNFIAIFGSLAIYFITIILLYEVLPISWLPSQSKVSKDIVFIAFRLPQFWLCLLLTSGILLVPVLANRFFWSDTHPTYAERLRLQQFAGKRKPALKQRPRTSVSRKARSLRSGYAFSHSRGFGELISKGTLFKNIENLRIPQFQKQSPKRGSLTPTIDDNHSNKEGPGSSSQTEVNPGSSTAKSSPQETLTARSSPSGSASPSSLVMVKSSAKSSNNAKEARNRNPDLVSENLSHRPSIEILVLNHPEARGSPSSKDGETNSRTSTASSKIAALRDSPGPVVQSKNPKFFDQVQNFEHSHYEQNVSTFKPTVFSIKKTHKLVVNKSDDETPLPTNWQLNQNEECESVNNMNELERPSDFPELEQPPIPGTSHHWSRPQPTPFITNINIASTSNSSTMTGGSGPKKKFVSKSKTARQPPMNNTATDSSSTMTTSDAIPPEHHYRQHRYQPKKQTNATAKHATRNKKSKRHNQQRQRRSSIDDTDDSSKNQTDLKFTQRNRIENKDCIPAEANLTILKERKSPHSAYKKQETRL